MKALMALILLIVASAASAAGKSVTYEVNGSAYEGSFVSPNDKAPLVVLLHDWDGLTDYEKLRARMLSEQGYAVFAADLFGKGARPTKMEDKKQHTGELYKDRQKLRQIILAAIGAAKEQGADTQNAAMLGYCFGGAAVLELARSGADLQAYISVHGGLETPEGQSFSDAKGHFLIQHGAADTSVTMDQFSSLAQQMQAAELDFLMEVYGGAPHASTVFGGDRYREDADQQAWQSLLQFLARTLKL